MLIFAFALTVSFAVQRYLRAFAPSNVLIRRMRSSRPTMVGALGSACASLALLCLAVVASNWADSGERGWLHLLSLVLAWDALKFAWLSVLTTLRCANRATMQQHAWPSNGVVR